MSHQHGLTFEDILRAARRTRHGLRMRSPWSAGGAQCRSFKSWGRNELVTPRASGSLTVAALPVAAAVFVEAGLVAFAGAAFAGAPVPFTEAALAAVWAVGLWAWPAVLAVLLLGWLLGATVGAATVRERLREQWRRGPGLATGLLLAPWFLASVYGAALGASRFRNVELAAVLVALAAAASALGCAWFGWAIARQLPRWPERRTRFVFALGALLALAVVGLLVAASYPGLVQLEGRLWASPLAFLLCFAAADASAWVRSLRRRVLWGLFGLAAAGSCSLLFATPAAATTVASRGAWSRYLVVLAQRMSDWDRDGYSSLLGGGDCSAWAPEVHPGASEIPGDGLDNNCVGGDAGDAAAPARPSWGAQAHGSLTDLSIVVVTVETLRHDHVSFGRGWKRDTTPQLRALAKEALVFERMYASAPMTRLSLASLFSSYAPSEIDWQPQAREKRMRRIGPKTPWLPELLSARGYETIAVLADFAAFTAAENAGFERGFRHYDTSTQLAYRGGTMSGFPAAEQVDKALGYLDGPKRPFFLWLHLFEPHFLYQQPPLAPVFGSDEQSLYDAEIWHVDNQLGRLFAGLRQRGRWDDTVLLVTGDHGEAFGEHGDRWHGSNLHDPQLRPAALLKVPGLPGKRIEAAVTFTDMAPTLARILGDRQSFEQLRGRSLSPLLHRGKLPAASSSFVTESFSADDGHAYMAALIDYPFKLIYSEEGRRFTLFDLSRDPGELSPLEPGREPRGPALVQQLVGYLERARPATVGAARR